MAKKRTLQEYSDLYQIPLGTVMNYRRRKWPIDDPAALLAKIYESPGKKPDLAVLERLATGQATERVRASESKSKPDAPHLEDELDHLRDEVRRSYKDFDEEPSPIRRIPLHKVYIANMKALATMIPLATKALQEADRLVSSEGVAQLWSRQILEFRGKLERVGDRCARSSVFSKLDPHKVQGFVNYEIAVALAELAGEEPPEKPKAYTGPSSGCSEEMVPFHALYEKLTEKYGHDRTTDWSDGDRALLKSLRPQ